MPVTVLNYPASDYQSEPGQVLQNSKPGYPEDPSLPTQNVLDFDDMFPSLIKTSICLRDARNSRKPDILEIISIAETFIPITRSAIDVIHKLFVDAHVHERYIRCKSAAEHAISVTDDKIKVVGKDPTLKAINTVYGLGDIVLANLRELLVVAVRITKPLPQVPQGALLTEHPSTKYRLSPSEHFSSSASDASGSSTGAGTPKGIRKKILQSTDDRSMIRSGPREFKGESFSTLVRMLTSKDAIFDRDFIPAFFAGVRDFGSVKLLYQELKKRFDETAPDYLEPELLEAWMREAYHTRKQVAKVLFLWLANYWQPYTDGSILGPLHTFSVERLRDALPESLVVPLLKMIDSRMTGDESYDLSHHKGHFKFVASRVVPPKTDSTGFSYPDKFDKDVEAVLSLFNTEVGKEEFAQQLTAIISAMLYKINPQHVVAYWYTHSDFKPGPSLSETTEFAQSLAMYITHSIVMRPERDQRCRHFEFWVNIATVCLDYRNYFGSYCIFVGISHSATSRLKRTILELSRAVKTQFGRLEQSLSGRHSHIRIRKAIDEKTAATAPLLAPLNSINAKPVLPVIKSDEPNNEKRTISPIRYRALIKTIRAMESALVPYGIPENAQFSQWLKMTLRRYPASEEAKLCNALYGESLRIEPEANDLEQLNNPWLHYIELTNQGRKILIHEDSPN
ncbi:hypothetical protein AX15_002667 [Amanita polypyramis BW_CC]|nr:hypothetical protein AX15_002667 [Amanita polypyramis BW_CC]